MPITVAQFNEGTVLTNVVAKPNSRGRRDKNCCADRVTQIDLPKATIVRSNQQVHLRGWVKGQLYSLGAGTRIIAHKPL